jgi:uncharacterized protein (DUF736 family)
MNNQQKDNSGALFLNKSDNPKAPTHKGKVVVNGVKLDIAGWKQTSDKGVTYISLKFQPPFKKDDDGEEGAF